MAEFGLLVTVYLTARQIGIFLLGTTLTTLSPHVSALSTPDAHTFGGAERRTFHERFTLEKNLS
jgi:hypothetical protein